MKKLDEITIADLMPDSISSDREVSATARAIDPQLKVISEGVDLPLILASIDTLSAGVLEHLAAQYDLTAWDSAWPISTKRAVLKTAIADKRKKGTRGAVQRAIEAVAPLATITEWWEKTPQGTPHTFEIDVLQDGEAVDAETVADVIAQVNDSKPVRSHFTFSVGQKAEGNMYLSGVIRTIAYARVRSSGMTAVQTEIDAGVLAALRGMNIRRIMEFSHMGDMPEPTPVVPSIPMGGVLTSTSDSVILVPVVQAGGSVEITGYAYPDGALLDMSWDFGGVVEEYSPAPALPTVSTTWLSIGGSSGNVIIVPNEDHVGYWWDSDSQSYISADWDSNVTYGIIALYTTPFAYSGRMELEIKEVSGTVGVRNVSSSSVTVCQANIAICSSSSATVITVYDSSNNPYNAFKYTSDGTDYYYVLDGTQTDWTNDLSSIGYKLPPTIITLYMVPNRYRYVQPNVIKTSSPNSSYCYQMYTSESVQDDSTKFIPDPTKNYINVYYSSQTGEWVDSSSKYDVSQMPDSTGGDEVELRQVLDDGRLWIGTNKTPYWYATLNLVRFRVADKL